MPGERGFTLIELLVVLAILAAATAMVLPSFGNALPRGALGAATADIRAALRTAAFRAVSEDRTVTFRGDAGGGYWLDDTHRRLAGSGDTARTFRVRVAGRTNIAFFPWGGSSGGRVWIENPQVRRAIDVDAVTGRAVAKP